MATAMVFFTLIFCLPLAGVPVAKIAVEPAQLQANQSDSRKAAPPAEDISGTYSFLKEGELVQINLDKDGVTGYVSRMGELESDRGSVLDHVFTTAAVEGHAVRFVTRQVHGVWFEFNGKFDHGPGKTKNQDGYYVLRGTLKEYMVAADKKVTSRSRDVEFKFMAEPDDDEPPAKPKK